MNCYSGERHKTYDTAKNGERAPAGHRQTSVDDNKHIPATGRAEPL